MASGRVRKCHTDQLRIRTVQADIVEWVEAVPDSNNHSTEQLPEPSTNVTNAEPSVVQPDNDNVQCHSTRAHKPVDCYEPKW